ncbi:hypothetical protein JXM67_01340 [candidate division WOR-3 bacterium]|nr:hypothetical protein [candidate division WOR-3 bacterium]
MDSNLFTAYNYLSSAIAQAFAALIALTAMFYIYRMGILRNRMSKLKDSIRQGMEDFLIDKIDNSDPPKKLSWEFLRNLDFETLEKLYQSRSKGGNFENRFRSQLLVSRKQPQYLRLRKFESHLRWVILPPILLSALTMLAGITALLWGYQLCDAQRVLIMYGESILAAVALIWTVVVVIIMLGEPGKKKTKPTET